MPKPIVVTTVNARSFKFTDDGREYLIKGEGGKFLVERTDAGKDEDEAFWGEKS